MNPKISTFIMTENHDFDMSHPALSRTTVQPGPGSAVHYKNSVYLLHSVELGVFSQFTGSPALQHARLQARSSCAAAVMCEPGALDAQPISQFVGVHSMRKCSTLFSGLLQVGKPHSSSWHMCVMVARYAIAPCPASIE